MFIEAPRNASAPVSLPIVIDPPAITFVPRVMAVVGVVALTVVEPSVSNRPVVTDALVALKLVADIFTA